MGGSFVQEQMNFACFFRVLKEVKAGHGSNTANFPHFLVPHSPLDSKATERMVFPSTSQRSFKRFLLTESACYLAFSPAKQCQKTSALRLLSRQTEG